MYNEIDGNFEDIAISTFKSGLPIEHGLRKSLTGKPITSLGQLMDRIDKYKGLRKTSNWVKERPRLSLRRGGISSRTSSITTVLGEILLDNQGLPTVNVVFREPVHQVLEKIKN